MSVIISILFDIILVNTAEWLAFITRFGLILPPEEMGHYQSIWFLLTLVRIWALYSNKVYENRLRSFFLLSTSIIKASFISTVLIVAVTFFNRTLAYSRLVILISLVFTIILLLCKHYIYWRFFLIHRKKRNVIIIGVTEAAKRLINDSEMFRQGAWQLKGFLDDKKKTGLRVYNQFQVLGKVNDIRKIMKKKNIHLAVIALPNDKIENRLKIMTECENVGIEYLIIPNFYEIVTGRSKIDEFEDFPVLEPVKQPITLLSRILKRLFDICFSFCFLLVILPLLLVIAVLIKIESRGSIVYKQFRGGKTGNPFFVYKFRTMITGADRIGPKLTQKNDRRITRIGKFLRRWSLDELPQFINVLLGDMSVVGPRPEVVEIVKNYKAWQRKVLQVKPGLTGYAQIRGRQELDIDTKLQMDLYYINNYSFLLDMEIIFKTILTVLKGEGAY